MNCFYHNDTPACAQCPTCGMGLCNICATQYPKIICDACHNKEILYLKMQEQKTYLWSILFAASGVVYTFFTAKPTFPLYITIVFALIAALFGGGIPFGWRFISKVFTGKYLLIMPIIGWLVLFVIKMVAACYIGWIVLICTMFKKMFFKKKYS